MDQLPSKKLNRYEKVFSALLHAEFRSHSPRNSGSSLMTSRRRREHTKKWQIQVEEKKRMTKCTENWEESFAKMAQLLSKKFTRYAKVLSAFVEADLSAELLSLPQKFKQ